MKNKLKIVICKNIFILTAFTMFTLLTAENLTIWYADKWFGETHLFTKILVITIYTIGFLTIIIKTKTEYKLEKENIKQ